ncbi:hypothetical protein DVH24_034376 [Malus domestica]|uniref:Interferon-related developmental regulator N-terminal domain-containing protein n=1 Tax=Malus domestica TaxID=3750 RepID=A0A498IW79_MALDO|nr:hypothetical protein DVH24_034376 [Malus domestica]
MSSHMLSNMMRRGKAAPPSAARKRGGERKTGRRPGAVAADESTDNELVIRPPKLKTLSFLLEGLFEKRGSDREEALASIIEGLNRKLDHEFLENNFATFLFRSLNCLKKGSNREKQLSLHVIGLLAIVICCEDKLSEIYKELLPVFSKVLKSGPTTLKILDCLAIVAFFGATNSEETESAMQIIWKFINPESASDVNTQNHSAEVLVAAVYAWLFLLTSMEGWRLSHNYWNGAISYFSNLLEHDNKLVRIAASEALALIFETGSLEKFWSEAKDPSLTKYSHMQLLLKENVLKKLNCLYSDIRNENVANKVREVVKYFESSRPSEFVLTVNGKGLKLSSWYQIIQENEKLQNLFEFNPHRNKNLGPELYESTTDKITVCFFVPEERDPDKLTKEDRKKERVWRNALLDKARTQLMRKHRLMSQEMNSCCYDFEQY